MARSLTQTLLGDLGLGVFNDGPESLDSGAKRVANRRVSTDRSGFSPAVSLPHASLSPSAAAGGSGTPSSLLRVAQPSACPEPASRIQWAKGE